MSGTEFALFDLGAQCMGVPSHNVAQAIAYPAQISRLPRSKQALVGVFVHRGQVVPLLDLRHWMDPVADAPATTPQAQQVLILKADIHTATQADAKTQPQVFAIPIDALRGLLRVAAADVQQIHHDDDAQEFFHSVVRAPDGHGLISVLDPCRLARQAQVWAAGQAMAQPGLGDAGFSTEARSAGLAQTISLHDPAATCAVVRLGTTLLALPAAAVGEVVSDIRLQKVAGVGSHFLGMAQWRGQELPLLDLAQVLGLPPTAQRSMPWLLVLTLEARALAFYVDDICAVRSFSAGAVQQGASLSDAMRRFCQGSSLMPGGARVYLLNPGALLDASPLSNLARPARSSAAGNATPAATSGAEASAASYAGVGAASTETQSVPGAARLGYAKQQREAALVVFKSRQLWAASMDQMREIVVLPAVVHAAFAHDGVLPITMEWRDQALALLDLRQTLDARPSVLSEQARVIITQLAGQTVGLLVESVDALVPGHSSSRLRFVAQGVPVEMVTVGAGGSSGPQTSYQLMDLGQLPVLAAA